MQETWIWLQQANHDPVVFGIVLASGIALVASILFVRVGVKKVTTKLFAVRASRKDEKDAIAACWASESDLIDFELLKPAEKGWMKCIFRR